MLKHVFCACILALSSGRSLSHPLALGPAPQQWSPATSTLNSCNFTHTPTHTKTTQEQQDAQVLVLPLHHRPAECGSLVASCRCCVFNICMHVVRTSMQDVECILIFIVLQFVSRTYDRINGRRTRLDSQGALSIPIPSCLMDLSLLLLAKSY